MTDTITYETLYEVVRKEKYNPTIQELDKEFFKSVMTYLEEKERLITQSPADSAFSKEISTTKKQLENAKRLIKELYERRESKIIQLALLSSRSGKADNPPLLDEEQKLFSDTITILSKYRKEIMESVLNKQQPVIKETPKTIKTEKKESHSKLVRFIHPTPQFVTPDLQIYGPFEKEDLSLLPAKVASTLMKKKRAEEIKDEKN